MAACGDRPSRRCPTRAKSIIMIAFFITTPISRKSPSSAIRLKLVPLSCSASSAPTPADGRGHRMHRGRQHDLGEHPLDGLLRLIGSHPRSQSIADADRGELAVVAYPVTGHAVAPAGEGRQRNPATLGGDYLDLLQHGRITGERS